MPSVAEGDEAAAKLAESAAGLAGAADAVRGLLELARMTEASGRKGRDLILTEPQARFQMAPPNSAGHQRSNSASTS